jgi:RNA-directed DNA polymerase
VIERPKRKLKEIQRLILHEILERIPPHEAAHGFTRGRSVRTHARCHVGQRSTSRISFASVGASRGYGVFPHRRLPGERGVRAGGVVHERRPGRRVGTRAAPGRRACAGRVLVVRPTTGDAARAAGRADHLTAPRRPAARHRRRGQRTSERAAPRREYDCLRAVLHNAIRDGAPEARRAHLLGRISWVESPNPAHGARLCATFDRIEWL